MTTDYRCYPGERWVVRDGHTYSGKVAEISHPSIMDQSSYVVAILDEQGGIYCYTRVHWQDLRQRVPTEVVMVNGTEDRNK